MKTSQTRGGIRKTYGCNEIKKSCVQYSYYDEEKDILYLRYRTNQGFSYSAYSTKKSCPLASYESMRLGIRSKPINERVALKKVDFTDEKKQWFDKLISAFDKTQGKPEIVVERASTATSAFFGDSAQSSASDTKKTDTISLKHTI